MMNQRTGLFWICVILVISWTATTAAAESVEDWLTQKTKKALRLDDSMEMIQFIEDAILPCEMIANQGEFRRCVRRALRTFTTRNDGVITEQDAKRIRKGYEGACPSESNQPECGAFTQCRSAQENIDCGYEYRLIGCTAEDMTCSSTVFYTCFEDDIGLGASTYDPDDARPQKLHQDGGGTNDEKEGRQGKRIYVWACALPSYFCPEGYPENFYEPCDPATAKTVASVNPNEDVGFYMYND